MAVLHPVGCSSGHVLLAATPAGCQGRNDQPVRHGRPSVLLDFHHSVVSSSFSCSSSSLCAMFSACFCQMGCVGELISPRSEMIARLVSCSLQALCRVMQWSCYVCSATPCQSGI